jgi:hypothetical protein
MSVPKKMDYPTRKAPPIPDPFKKEWVMESTKMYIENNYV